MKNYILLGLLFGAMAAGGCTSSKNASEATAENNALPEIEGVYAFRVGQFEVYMMVESEREGNAGILVNAEEAIKQYIPASGFKHSTNAFLIKAPGQIILVDTAFGGAVFEKMEKIGVKPEEVNAVLITHLHGDHTGGLVKDAQARLPNAKIYLSAKEYEYFTKTNVNPGAVAALAPYSVETFEPGQPGGTLSPILPGISPIANYGHTPGHTIYLLENGGEKFLIVGDLLHVALVQFPVPEISATYDMDQKAAAEVRRQVLDYASSNNIPIGGMHMVYPAVGKVETAGTGFKFVPAE